MGSGGRPAIDPAVAHEFRGDELDTSKIAGIYETRFDERRVAAKMAVWAEIARFLATWVDQTAPVLDIACDAGYFIRHVGSADRWATDLRDVSSALPPRVRFVQADGLDLRDHLPGNYFGTVFMSNYLEHLQTTAEVLDQLRVAHDLLRPGGRLIVLQPNIRLTGPSYWDFIDHHVPLTDQSLTEAVKLAGLRPIHVVQRFLPYSTKGRLPQHPALVRWYLRLPIVWHLLGKQSLVIAEKP